MGKTAGDIMTASIVSVRARDSVKKVIATLVEHKISGAPVVSEATGKMIGFISEYDLILAVHSVGSGLDVEKAMKRGIVSVQPTTPVDEIADLMLIHKIRRVPVIDREGRPVGIVSRREVLVECFLEA